MIPKRKIFGAWQRGLANVINDLQIIHVDLKYNQRVLIRKTQED